jgi:hypothetical protein
MAEHKYVVHQKSDGRARPINGSSFEDAALIYLEEFHPPANRSGEVMLIVRQTESGREQCFRIEVSSGRTAPCE